MWNLKDVGVVPAKAGPGSHSCTYRASSLFHTHTEDPVPGTEGHSRHKAPSKVFGPMRGPGAWGQGRGSAKAFPEGKGPGRTPGHLRSPPRVKATLRSGEGGRACTVCAGAGGGGGGDVRELRAAEMPPTPEGQAEWVLTWAEAGCGHLHRSSGGSRLHYCER